ncbi:MAG: hypothetical protein AB8B78_02115 [Polaribacter sp.]
MFFIYIWQMKAKWYISTLLFISLCFGAFQEQVFEPNQEIILEFVDTKIHKKNIENTISELKEKLVEIGVTNILIQETQKGTLKISYYSVVDVESIKNTLTEENELALNKKSENKKNSKESYNYKIDVYELTNKIDISDIGNNFIFEIKYQSDRFTTNNFLTFSRVLDFKEHQLFKTAFKANKNNPFTKDFTSHQEPEVRAGPKNHLI